MALADLLSKCLAANAGDRYQTAAELAGDLRRHLSDLPLKGVANRSLTERWRKWRRRQPYALLLGCIVLGAIVAACYGLVHVQQQADRARNALGEGLNQLRSGQYNDAVILLTNGMMVVDSIPGYTDLRNDLKASLGKARRSQEAQHLHSFVNKLRGLYGEELDSESNWQAKEYECRHFWSRRPDLLDDAGSLDDRLRRQIHSDYLDLGRSARTVGDPGRARCYAA